MVKQRIVGSIVLGLLILVIMPLLLNGGQRPGVINRDGQGSKKAIPIEIPKRTTSRSERGGGTSLPNKKPVKRPTSTVRSPAPKTVKPAQKGGQPSLVKGRAVEKSPTKISNSGTPPKAVANSKEQWLIQLGSFQRKENAQGLLKRLKAGGHRPRIEKSGNSYRVRIGPLQGRQAADRAKQQIEKQIEVQGLLLQVVPSK